MALEKLRKMPTLFIPHGGGPCFFMDPPRDTPHLWDGLATYLRGIDASLGAKPKAVLVISGHWETARPTFNVAEQPRLLFDYYGFPDHTYQLKYPVAGAPALAKTAARVLSEAGIETDIELKRGLDHGVFVPFLLIYPQADVPILQMSLQGGLDPGFHLKLGRALAPLRDQGVLIVGSGMSYHNMAGLFSGRGGEASVEFDTWLCEAVKNPLTREDELARWRQAPGGKSSHPREEHLIPLMVAAGAGLSDPAVHSFGESIGGKMISGFQFG
jgi:aromatic ring-opening dioxygenase catalytic subunit (LigB family)